MNLIQTVERAHCVSTDQALLWNIQELLKEALVLLKPQEDLPFQEEPLCHLCGGDHKNAGVRLACAKKNKNKEG